MSYFIYLFVTIKTYLYFRVDLYIKPISKFPLCWGQNKVSAYHIKQFCCMCKPNSLSLSLSLPLSREREGERERERERQRERTREREGERERGKERE